MRKIILKFLVLLLATYFTLNPTRCVIAHPSSQANILDGHYSIFG